MAFNIFKSQPKKETKSARPGKTKAEVSAPVEVESRAPSVIIPTSGHALRNIHVSEKASRLTAINQYTFRISTKANKQEIKKQVEKMFNVKVSKIRVITMPSKSRNVGRYEGTKSGYRKAVVTLMEGYSINEAKA